MNHVARNWAGNLELSGPRGKQAVLKELGDFANEFWAAWPSRNTLAKKLKLTPATVSNYLRDLVKDGLLVPVPWCNEEGGDAGNGYFLTGCPDSPNFAPIDVAFKERRYGHPRGFKPAWWSGEKGTGKASQQPPEDDEIWGEGNTDMRGASHPYEGEGNISVRGRVTPVSPLEPLLEPPQDPPSKTSLSPQQRASPPADPTNEREIIREEVEAQPEESQARPQEQRPTEKLYGDDALDAYVDARRDGGRPATGAERVQLRAAIVELHREGHTMEYLVRLADWMGRERPGWTNLGYARTAPGAPVLVPGQRDPDVEQDGPCAPGACAGHDHPQCDLGWIDIDDRLSHCPCWSTPKPKPGEHQTYRNPPQSAYYDPKAKPEENP